MASPNEHGGGGDWANAPRPKDEDAGKSPDVVIEKEDEDDQPKVAHFRPYNLSRKVLSDSMEASYFDTTVLIQPYKPSMMNEEVFQRCIQMAMKTYIHAKEESSFIKLIYKLHAEAEKARASLENRFEGCTVSKASKEHTESMIIDGDILVELLPKNETKAQYRSRMLLVSLQQEEEEGSEETSTPLPPPPQTGTVLDAILQLFPDALGTTMPMPRQKLLDTTFHGFAVVLYPTNELAKASYKDWKDKEITILGKKVKIDLYQQVAAEVEKKRTEKTDDKKSPKSKKTIAQTLAEIGSVKVPSKPLSAGEREQMTQRMKECKRVLANLRYMKHNANPAAAKQRQTIRRQLVQELQRITGILKGDKNGNDDEDEEEKEDVSKTKTAKPTDQKKSPPKKQNNKTTMNKKPMSSGTAFFTQPQYRQIYPRPYDPQMSGVRPPPPAFISAPSYQGPRGPRFIPPGSLPPKSAPAGPQRGGGAAAVAFNMKEVHEVNRSLQDLQQQVDQLAQQFQNAPGALGGQTSPRGLLGDYPQARGRGGRGRGAAGRGASVYRGYEEDEGFGNQRMAETLRGITESLNHRMAGMGLSGDYNEEQFDDYYEQEVEYGGGYHQKPPPHRRMGFGEPEYGDPYYQAQQHRPSGFGGAGRGSGSYSQAKMAGFKQPPPPGRGRGMLQLH